MLWPASPFTKLTRCPTTLSADGGGELKVFDRTTENSKKWEPKLQDLEGSSAGPCHPHPDRQALVKS